MDLRVIRVQKRLRILLSVLLVFDVVVSEACDDGWINMFGSFISLRVSCRSRHVFDIYAFANKRKECAYKVWSVVSQEISGNAK